MNCTKYFWSTCEATIWLFFCRCFPFVLFIYFLSDFGMVPVAAIISGIAFVFSFHMYYCKVFIFWEFAWRLSSSSLYLLQFKCLLTDTFLCPFHGLWRLVYWYRLLCSISMVDYIVWLLYFHDIFLLALAYAHNSEPYLILTILLLLSSSSFNSHSHFPDTNSVLPADRDFPETNVSVKWRLLSFAVHRCTMQT